MTFRSARGDTVMLSLCPIVWRFAVRLYLSAQISCFLPLCLNRCLWVCFAGGHSVCHSVRMSHICLLSAVCLSVMLSTVCVSVMLSAVCVCHAVHHSVCQFSISVKMSAYLSPCLFIWLSSCLSLFLFLNASALYSSVHISVCRSVVPYIPVCLSDSLSVGSIVCLLSATLSDDVFLSVDNNNMNIFHIYW